MNWYNEPPGWSVQGSTISVQTGPETDFWRLTHYGFIRDSGHFYSQAVTGNFLAEVKVSGTYAVITHLASAGLAKGVARGDGQVRTEGTQQQRE